MFGINSADVGRDWTTIGRSLVDLWSIQALGSIRDGSVGRSLEKYVSPSPHTYGSFSSALPPEASARLLDELHGPSLRGAADRDGPHVAQEGVEGVELRAEVALDVVHGVDEPAVHLDLPAADDLLRRASGAGGGGGGECACEGVGAGG